MFLLLLARFPSLLVLLPLSLVFWVSCIEKGFVMPVSRTFPSIFYLVWTLTVKLLSYLMVTLPSRRNVLISPQNMYIMYLNHMCDMEYRKGPSCHKLYFAFIGHFYSKFNILSHTYSIDLRPERRILQFYYILPDLLLIDRNILIVLAKSMFWKKMVPHL